jgi:hypothetical protein
MATLHLDRLHCNTTEDNTGADDAYIKVNGKRVWGPYAINDGEGLDIGVSVGFDDQAAIELWDEDSPDSDDILGRHVVRLGASGQLKFNNDDSDYDLSYRTS